MANARKGNLLYEGESYEIRGACFSVYNALGGGIKEKTIELALEKEFLKRNLEIKRQERIDIKYRNEKIGFYIPDFIINGKIIVEIKSKPFITKDDEKQFWSYLKGSDYTLGFLVNFGPQRLSIKRYIHTNKTS